MTMRLKSRKWLLAGLVALGGTASFSPVSQAVAYNNTVNPAVTTLVNGDTVTTTNQLGINDTSTVSPGVQIGSGGKITVNSTFNSSDATPAGGQRGAVVLKNNVINNFGAGSEVTASYVSGTYPASNNNLYGIATGAGADLKASRLKVMVSSAATAAGFGAYGLSLLGKADLGTGSSISVSNINGGSVGIVNSKNFTADHLTLNVQGDNASAIQTSANSTLDLGVGSNITSSAKTIVNGIVMSGGSSLVADNLTLTLKPEVGATVQGGPAIMMNSNNAVNVKNNSTIRTEVSGSAGVYIFGNNSTFSADNNLSVITTGINSQGLIAQGTNTVVNTGTNATITTYGDTTYGASNIPNYSSSAVMGRAGGKVIIGDGSKLTTYGSGFSNGIFLYGNDSKAEVGNNVIVRTEGNGAYGLMAYSGAPTLTAGQNLQVTTVGANSTGVLSQNNANVNLGQKASIRSQGSNSYVAELYGNGILTADGASFVADSDTSEVIHGEGASKITLTGTSGATTINGANGNGAAITLLGTSQLTGSGVMNVAGNITNGDTSNVNLTMGAGSSLKGAWNTASTATGKMDLTGGTWTMTGDSTISNLALHGGNVNFATDLSGGTFGTLTVGTLDGNGSFGLRTNLANNQGDLLNVTGAVQGLHQLHVNNQGSASVDPTQELTIVKTGSSGSDAFSLTNAVEVGAFEYYLKQSGTDWNLYAIEKPPTPPGPGPNPEPQYTTTASADINMMKASYLMNYAETQTLLQRLGDLRQGEGKNDIWARIYGGSFDVSDHDGVYGFGLDYTSFQAGYDRKVYSDPKKGDIYVGATLGYGNGNLDLYKGSGSLDSMTLGAYGTYVSPNGFYVDSVLKYGHQKGDFRVLDTAGAWVKSDDMKSDGFFGSLEVGKRIHFNSKTKEGWYVEPQAQISTGHQGGFDTLASNGLYMQADGYNSTLGRVGMNVGYEVKSGKNPIHVYVKASYVHEFDGDMNVNFNGIESSQTMGDSWWSYGLGITGQISKKHNVYLDVERASGGEFKQSWQINGGYRFSW